MQLLGIIRNYQEITLRLLGNYQETTRKLLGIYQEILGIPCVCQDSTRTLLGIYWESLGNTRNLQEILGLYQESTRNLLGIYQECTRNLLGIYQESQGNTRNVSTRNLLGIQKGISRKYQESTWNLLGIYWESTGNLLGMYQETPEARVTARIGRHNKECVSPELSCDLSECKDWCSRMRVQTKIEVELPDRNLVPCSPQNLDPIPLQLCPGCP